MFLSDFNSRFLQNATGPPAGGKTTYVKISTHASYKMRPCGKSHCKKPKDFNSRFLQNATVKIYVQVHVVLDFNSRFLQNATDG